jgi:hypothetical protein
VHLFHNGKEIPGPDSAQGIPQFLMSPQSGTYRLEAEDAWPNPPRKHWPNGAVHRLTPRTTTVATFNSSPPASNVPSGYSCLDGNKCAFQPVIQVDYQLGLDLLNQAPAGRTHTFEVNVGSHEAAESAGEIKAFGLSYSTDDGDSWSPATVVRHGPGKYTVQITHPKLEATNGFISLRAEAWDSVGNRMNQIMQRAYALTNEPTQ